MSFLHDLNHAVGHAVEHAAHAIEHEAKHGGHGSVHVTVSGHHSPHHSPVVAHHSPAVAHHSPHHGHHSPVVEVHASNHAVEHALEHAVASAVHVAAHHSPVVAHHSGHHSPVVSVHASGHAVDHAIAHAVEHAAVTTSLASAVGSALAHTVGHVMEFIDSKNQISLSLKKLVYVGGEVVEGTVHLNCVVPFQAKGVLVKMKGYETAAWEEWRTKDLGNGQNERYIHTHKEKKEFFKDNIRVYPYEGLVQPGQYSFPFTYQLPPSLPGTFYEKGGHWKNGNGYVAEIIYFAQAKIDVKFKHDLKKKVPLIVNERFDQYVQPSYGENNKSFLLTKGKLHAKVWLDKNIYFPGNTVIAKLEANNTSVKPTNKVNVKVIKVVHLHAHGASHTVRNEIYRQSYKGFEPSFYGVRWLPFQVPCNVQPSTSTGKHVKCQYLFVVECDIPGAIDLQVDLPTAILAPQWLFSAAPPAPPMAVLPPDCSFRPPWQPDNTCHQCNKCSVGFSLLKRRHHCRHCGKIFCSHCTTRQTHIKNLGYHEPVRVCDGCFDKAATGGHAFQAAPVLEAAPAQEYVPENFTLNETNMPSAPPSFKEA